jgi:hypothetical protein
MGFTAICGDEMKLVMFLPKKKQFMIWELSIAKLINK